MKPEQLKAELSMLSYPLYLVAHGPAREHRTTYRSEHHGVFRSGTVSSPDEAYQLIMGTRYPGHLGDMSLIAITIEDGELTERELPLPYGFQANRAPYDPTTCEPWE